jgi:hypothetical protein
MIEDREYVERLVDTNLAFLKTIPSSVQYWAVRKKDPFAMIRQTGKPTAFLTMSANETDWSGCYGYCIDCRMNVSLSALTRRR